MPQGIVIACPKELTLLRLESLLGRHIPHPINTFHGHDTVQFAATDMSWYVDVREWVDADDAILDYWTNEDLDSSFRDECEDKRYFSIDFNDYRVFRKLLMDVLSDTTKLEEWWIDADHGWVFHGPDLLRRLRDDSWDWRLLKPGSPNE